MSRICSDVLRYSNILTGLFLAVPMMFLAVVFLPIEFSNAAEDEVTIEICSPDSKVIIATDGGVVDLSGLEQSPVARVSGGDTATESVIKDLQEVCGFTSFVMLNGDGSSAYGGRQNVDLTVVNKSSGDKVSLSDALLESCNYDAVMLEVQKEDICAETTIPKCTGDQKASPWLEEEDRGYLWSNERAYLWSNQRGYLWSNQRGYLWSNLNVSPWLESNDVCVDDRGYLWSNERGYLWSNGRGYLWSNERAYLWSNERGVPFIDERASPWLNSRVSVWTDWARLNANPSFETRFRAAIVIIGLTNPNTK